MIDFDSNIDKVIKFDESIKEQRKHIEHMNRLAYETFEANPFGKEFLSYYIAQLMVPLTSDQLKDPKGIISEHQLIKSFLRMIKEHKQHVQGSK